MAGVMRKFCEHGMGGFFKCRHGCHSESPEKDHEETEDNIDYLFKRLEAHGMSLGNPIPPFVRKD